MSAPTAIDLFCGAAGAWTLGATRAGFRIVAAAENDAWRRGAYAINWPEVTIYDDIETLNGTRIERDRGPIDCVFGSPPCQDASAANAAGQGVDGQRTGLFLEAIRIIREVRPLWVCFENSPHLMHRGGDRILGWLDDAGYQVWAIHVRSEDVGAPCIRERVFITGRAKHAEQSWRSASDAAGADQIRIPQDVAGQPRKSVSSAARAHNEGQHLLPFHGRALARRRRIARSGLDARWRLWGPDYVAAAGRHLRMAARIPTGLAGKVAEAYGDAFSPQVAEAIARSILNAERSVTSDLDNSFNIICG